MIKKNLFGLSHCASVRGTKRDELIYQTSQPGFSSSEGETYNQAQEFLPPHCLEHELLTISDTSLLTLLQRAQSLCHLLCSRLYKHILPS